MTARRRPAAAPPKPATPATSGKCAGATKSGRPCPNAGPLCVLHDPARRDERRRLMAERGRSGQAKRTQRQRDRRREAATAATLATLAGIREALERALARVEESGADPVKAAGAVAKLGAVAVAILRVGEIDAELAALKALVDARFSTSSPTAGTA